MLKRIQITNFALFDQVDIEVERSFVVVTGETGAGKSLFLQSLKFLSGAKKPSTPPPLPELPSEVACTFSRAILGIAAAHIDQAMLASITQDSAENIVIKRSLSPSGKSKVTFAGMPITSAVLKPIMQAVVEINAQHQHLDVLDLKSQTALLDRYGDYPDLLASVSDRYQRWQRLVADQKKWQLSLAELDDIEQLQLIQADLESLNLDDIDFDQLHNKQKRLQGRQTFLHACQTLSSQLDGDQEHAVISQLHQAINTLSEYNTLYPDTQTASQLLDEALTNSREAAAELQHYLDDDYSLDAEQLQTIEKTLSTSYATARKYRIQPEDLKQYYEKVCQQIDTHQHCQTQLASISTELESARQSYQLDASALSEARCRAAQELAACIQSQLPSLNLAHALFHVKISPEQSTPSALGTDLIQFLFTGNPGIPLSPLAQCASGGELARLALLLSSSTPAAHQKVLVFDEADVGVSGKTASLIGQLLAKLSTQHQIICLTHSPQVAACGQQHWHIEKNVNQERTATTLKHLSDAEHIEEVARLLSGMDVTAESLASAEILCHGNPVES